MQAILKRFGGSGGRGLLGTQRGTMIVAAGTAFLAAIVLLVFLGNYRNSTTATQPMSVLVADRVIAKGTSGDVIAEDLLFKPQSIPQNQVADGALESAAPIAGKVAVKDIYPGQQITAAHFVAGADSVRGRLRGSQRAMSIPIDGAHGLLSEVRAGDKIDILAGFNTVNGGTGQGRPMVRTLARNVLVLKAPAAADVGDVRKVSGVTLRLDERQAAAMAFAADNGKVWFVLRPPAGATETKTDEGANLETLLSGVKPIERNR